MIEPVAFDDAWLAACECNVLLSRAEGRALFDQVQRAPDEVLEIGSFCGGSAILMALAGARRLTLIEPRTTPELIAALGRFGLLHHVRLLPLADSQVWPFWTAPVSFLFLDHEHEYLAVRNSLVAWRRHLRPGALVAVHDYIAEEGVRAAIDELAPRLRVVEQVENLAFVAWRE
jgi:predicted O-methyltransferase YrrM